MQKKILAAWNSISFLTLTITDFYCIIDSIEDQNLTLDIILIS